MNSTITLPRSVAMQALEALKIGHESAHECAETFHIEMAGYKQQRHEELDAEVKQISDAIGVLRAALEQPQDHPEQHLDMVPEGWKLVPVKPTEDMLNAVAWPGCAATDWEHMLAAAPQPPTAEKSSGVEQPQGEQEPVAWQRRMRTKWMRDGEWWPWQECSKEVAYDYKQAPVIDDWEYESRPLYTRPQPRRQPLTNEQVKAGLIDSIDFADQRDRCAFNIGVRFAERAHKIGGEL